VPDFLLNTATLRTLNQALDGLAQRQQAISGNLANVDTPGYQAATVDFETALQRAEGTDHRLALTSTHAGHLASPSTTGPGAQLLARTGGSTRADGNNVDVDQELLELSTTGIQYQALSQLISKKLLLLKSIATGR